MKKKIVSVILIFVVIILNFNVVCANGPFDILDDARKPLEPVVQQYNNSLQGRLYGGGNNSVSNIGATIAGYIVYAGIVVAVVVLMLKGIKFITSSPEGKADVKKELIPWAVGIVILFSIQAILQFVVNFAQNNVNNLTI